MKRYGCGVSRRWPGLSYSIGWTLPSRIPQLYKIIPEHVWQPVCNVDRQVREGADVAELTDLLMSKGYPPGLRVIVRWGRCPHAGA